MEDHAEETKILPTRLIGLPELLIGFIGFMVGWFGGLLYMAYLIDSGRLKWAK